MKYSMLVIAVLSFSHAFCQIKLGNIVIDKKEADKYLGDCYRHGDTIKTRGTPIVQGVGKAPYCFSMHYYSGDREANIAMASRAIKYLPQSEQFLGSGEYFGQFIIPRPPSIEDYIKYKKRKAR